MKRINQINCFSCFKFETKLYFYKQSKTMFQRTILENFTEKSRGWWVDDTKKEIRFERDSGGISEKDSNCPSPKTKAQSHRTQRKPRHQSNANNPQPNSYTLNLPSLKRCLRFQDDSFNERQNVSLSLRSRTFITLHLKSLFCVQVFLSLSLSSP